MADRKTVLADGTNSPTTISSEDTGVSTSSDLAGKLPGAEKNGNNINWLGSSYSGADIKVVAHVYGQLDTTIDENRLVRERDFANNMIDALSELDSAQLLGDVSGRLSFDTLTQKYSGDGEIISAIDSFLNAFGGIKNSDVRSSAMTAAIADTKQYYQEIADGLQEQITKLETIRKEGSSTVVLATLQTISVQSHREKVPVRAFGSSHVKGYTRGGRQIAGTMIFTLFNEHALAQLMRSIGPNSGYKYGEGQKLAENSVSSFLADQLPPLDITIVFANEYGSLSRAALYGVEFMSDSFALSVEDLLTEEVINFVARDMDPVVSEGNIGLSRDQRGMHFNSDGTFDETATNLLFTSMDSYGKYLDKLNIRRGRRNR